MCESGRDCQDCAQIRVVLKSHELAFSVFIESVSRDASNERINILYSCRKYKKKKNGICVASGFELRSIVGDEEADGCACMYKLCQKICGKRNIHESALISLSLSLSLSLSQFTDPVMNTHLNEIAYIILVRHA